MKVCIVYTNSNIEEFKRKQKLKYNENLELVAKYINDDKKIKKACIFVLGTLFYLNDKVYAADRLGKIDRAGNTILEIVRRIGYWICIIACVMDIVKCLMQGDTKSIAKTMLKYALAFAALYIFPWILDLIRGIF